MYVCSKYIYTILSVFFSFIVICFYFTNISSYTCPKSVLMYDFKADIVTKNLLHFCPRAFFVNQLFSKMRKIENIKSFWSRVLIFQDSRFLFTAKLLRINMKNFTFQQVYKIALILRYHKYERLHENDGLNENDGLHENDGLIS